MQEEKSTVKVGELSRSFAGVHLAERLPLRPAGSSPAY
ncbi:hypothetical protein PLANPX_4236 [Lacipirellula parvula]|uniref:Uncharacterized protein n=1 Tax=Lacipirellula parvula TaxID=2650471 RepID=A0A5K7XCV9_9BACT|nr:hypothetical protein PLANPX_4236 [Lacipirellula parvula]